MYMESGIPNNSGPILPSVANEIGESGEKLVTGFNLPKYKIDTPTASEDTPAQKTTRPTRFYLRNTPTGLRRAVDIFLPVLLADKDLPNKSEVDETETGANETPPDCNQCQQDNGDKFDNSPPKSVWIEGNLENMLKENEAIKERAKQALLYAREINMRFNRGFIVEDSSDEESEDVNLIKPFKFVNLAAEKPEEPKQSH